MAIIFMYFANDSIITGAIISILQGVGDLPQGVGDLPQGVGDLPQGVGDLPQGVGDLKFFHILPRLHMNELIISGQNRCRISFLRNSSETT
jgi:hypothetical protein